MVGSSMGDVSLDGPFLDIDDFDSLLRYAVPPGHVKRRGSFGRSTKTTSRTRNIEQNRSQYKTIFHFVEPDPAVDRRRAS